MTIRYVFDEVDVLKAVEAYVKNFIMRDETVELDMTPLYKERDGLTDGPRTVITVFVSVKN